VMGEVKNFKYLRSFIQNDGDFSMDVSAVRWNEEEHRMFYTIREFQ
jgi:hypothetical protein